VTDAQIITSLCIEKINAESILLVRGENKINVTLNTRKERKQDGVSAKTVSSGALPDMTSRQSIPTVQSQAKPRPYMPPLPPKPNINTKQSTILLLSKYL